MAERRREVFDEDAERYDRARPGYPARLFDDLATLARLSPGSRILEIGCGTGQATVELARRGYAVVAVELGANLAGVAAERLAPFRNARVVVSSFESWPLPAEPFDAVVAFTSWHWVDPDTGLAKAARALRRGGALATVATDHVAGGTEQFFVDVQGCYERWMPGTPPGLRLPRADDVAGGSGAEVGRHFGPVHERRYETDVAYAAGGYVDVLRTYSDHGALEPRVRDGLFSCITSLIETRYGGLVVKRYLRRLRITYRSDVEPGGIA